MITTYNTHYVTYFSQLILNFGDKAPWMKLLFYEINNFHNLFPHKKSIKRSRAMSWNILTYLCLTPSHIVIEIISSISSCQNYITVRVRGTSFCSIWYLLSRTSYYRFLISDHLAWPGRSGMQEIFGDKQFQFFNNWD